MEDSTLGPLIQRWPDERLAIVTKGGPVSIFDSPQTTTGCENDFFQRTEARYAMQLPWIRTNERADTDADVGRKTSDH
jgi:hypothetical protein